MFNKGKAFLLSILGSIALVAIFAVIEDIVPFEEIFHYPSTTRTGWHTIIWIGVLFYFMTKYKQDKNYKTVRKVLLLDLMLFIFMAPIGFQKSIYDIQKFNAQKKGLAITDGKKFFIFAWLLYIFYIFSIVCYVFFVIFQEDNLEKLQRFMVETITHAKDQNTCALEYQPEFVSSCAVNFEQRKVVIQFKSHQYWLHGIEWSESYDVKITGNTFYFSFISDAEKLLIASLKAGTEKDFSKCLNPPDADNTKEEQMKLCQCMMDVRNTSMIQYLRETENKMERDEITENFDRSDWQKRMVESVNKDIKEKCGHLIHRRNKDLKSNLP